MRASSVTAMELMNSTFGGLWMGVNFSGAAVNGIPANGIGFSVGNNNIIFATGTTPAERMRISNVGNVGIGTINPSEKLEVAGNVKATEFLYTSDARLKKDVVTLPDALEKALQLRGVNFAWKADNNKTVGFIAQEVEQVYPELVRTDAKSGYKAVQYGNIVAVLVEALKQEHRERVENQNLCQAEVKNISRQIASAQSATEERVRVLEKENQELKARLERLEKIILQGK
ncbi:tail fiber domain-containing protein [Bdellovibrio bacteriovorus]|uniref:tail fiber domain-containing protein n=1 Tax=Bdellovibrio bacteriovorus TaxID=959 RepID=UPI0035A5F25A